MAEYVNKPKYYKDLQGIMWETIALCENRADGIEYVVIRRLGTNYCLSMPFCELVRRVRSGDNFKKEFVEVDANGLVVPKAPINMNYSTPYASMNNKQQPTPKSYFINDNDDGVHYR